jgi:hypothetical protein
MGVLVAARHELKRRGRECLGYLIYVVAPLIPEEYALY